MENQSKQKAARGFADAFAEALTASLATATGFSWPLEVADYGSTPVQKGASVHFRLTVEGALSGECFIEFYEPQVSDLISNILKQPIGRADEHGDALAQVISSALDRLSVSLSSRYGTLRFKLDRVAGVAFGGMYVVPLAASKEQTDAQVLLYFGGQFLDSLSSALEPGAGESDEHVVFPQNLRFVMDVELNVSLRFGQRQLSLREVLELGSGSVIELDRMVDDPVELFLDGKLIARGEAVVVDGNYGLRVTEIPQPLASHFVN